MSSQPTHVFALCAYKESPYLEDCVKSLLSQTVKSKIQLSTSTPNEHISAIAKKYDLPLYINEGEKGITGDWNFGVSMCHGADFITIAHQDDLYEPAYAQTAVAMMEKRKK